jgi:hypothetical protein
MPGARCGTRVVLLSCESRETGRTWPPAGIVYARTAQNWVQTVTTTLTGGTPVSFFTLTPCPAGVDYTSGAGYQVEVDGSISVLKCNDIEPTASTHPTGGDS